MVRPVATVNVTPRLPEALQRLEELAYNMRFAWDHDTIALFRRLDPELWESTYHNPVALLGNISQARLDAVSQDVAFMASFERVLRDFDAYMQTDNTWYRGHYGHLDRDPVIAYFSMEFGITECLQNYSGGLGILSGDHLKSASDLGLPLVGVGLLYQEGYFQQYLNAEGWQQESYPLNDYSNLPVQLERDDKGQPLLITVPMGRGTVLHAQVWKVQVGRVPLYLLDSNVPQNPNEDDRDLTDRLYGGNRRTRIRQEVLMGVGGIRMLEALNLRPDVVHMNEGHSAFSALERIRILMHEAKIDFYQAKEIIATSTVFTVHTPVPAGLERFGFDLIDEHFGEYMQEVGISTQQFHELGEEDLGGGNKVFSMSVMALAMSYGANGVAQLHGDVSRKMWQWMFPNLPEREVPIGAVTNGIHVQTWISREMGELLDRYLDPRWRDEVEREDIWAGIDNVPDAELWRTHVRRRERLVAFVRQYLRQSLIQRGMPQAEVQAADEVLNPDALTIGFARRFATYKRATLIFSDLDRLNAIVNDPERPVQFLFAGKAHPHDTGGKELIRQIVNVSRMPEFRHAIVFLENYDMNVTRYMLQGCDIWLNNPRRPREASGTSGMKVIYNGGLNFSILDGWWAEAYEPGVGWAIGNGEEYDDDQFPYQDEIESRAIYNILEQDIVPTFYTKGRDGLPRQWIAKMKHSMRTLAPFFTTRRMVQQYTDEYYMPNFQRISTIMAKGMKTAVAYADWRNTLNFVWHKVAIEKVAIQENEVEVGTQATIQATVQLADLKPEDVRVQLYYGPLDTHGEINTAHAQTMDMTLDEKAKANHGVYTFTCQHTYADSGNQGLTVRVVPHHEYLDTPFQPRLITWA